MSTDNQAATVEAPKIKKWSDLYQHYRPIQLCDVVGQKNAIKGLTNSAKRESWNHAYMFAGAYGSGKTSIARILASLIVCPNRKAGSDMACGRCKYCLSIHEGHCVDVIEMDGAEQSGVEEARDLKKSAAYAPQELKKKIYLIDECLGALTRINTDHGLIPICKIVNNRMLVKVRSYNETTGVVDYRNISNWFRNSGKDVYRLSFGRDGVLYASDGHLVSTPNGWKTVGELNEGDIVHRLSVTLNDIQEQLVFGSLLGDANITKNASRAKRGFVRGTCPRMRFVHGVKQLAYLRFKHELMRNMVKTNPSQCIKKTFIECGPIETWRFATVASPVFFDAWNLTMQDGKKTVSRQWLDRVGPMGMAFWFCDDGALREYKTAAGNHYSVTLHTQGFGLPGNVELQKWLQSKRFSGSILKEKKNGHTLYRIALDKDGSERFLQEIWPYVPDAMVNKLKNFIGRGKRFDYANMVFNSESVHNEVLVSKTFFRCESSTYDLEVEGNHNYFASGTLVHNCHRLSKEANSALLKVLEEPPPFVHFIFCTTDSDKVLPTIISRCQRFKLTKIPSDLMAQRLEAVAKREGIKLEQGVSKYIARLSDGSLRDGLGNLEQVAIFSNGDVNLSTAAEFFGLPEKRIVYEIVNAMVVGNISEMMLRINDLIMSCVQPRDILFEISNVLRNIFMVSTCGRNGKLLDINDDEIELVEKLVKLLPSSAFQKMVDALRNSERMVAVHVNERWVVESALVNCAMIINEAQSTKK